MGKGIPEEVTPIQRKTKRLTESQTNPRTTCDLKIQHPARNVKSTISITGCRDVGYYRNVRSLWNELDADCTGVVTLNELDIGKQSHILEDFTKLLIARYENLDNAWTKLFHRIGSGSGGVGKGKKDGGKKDGGAGAVSKSSSGNQLGMQDFCDELELKLDLEYVLGGQRGKSDEEMEAENKLREGGELQLGAGQNKVLELAKDTNVEVTDTGAEEINNSERKRHGAAHGTKGSEQSEKDQARQAARNARHAALQKAIDEALRPADQRRRYGRNVGQKVFRLLDYNKTGTVNREKFAILQLYYFEPPKVDANDDELEEDRRRRAGLSGPAGDRHLTEEERKEREKKKRAEEAVERRNRLIELKRQLTKRFGNLVRAWKYLDRDRNGKLSFTEFAKICMDLGPQILQNSEKVTKGMGVKNDAGNDGATGSGTKDGKSSNGLLGVRSASPDSPAKKRNSTGFGFGNIKALYKSFDKDGTGTVSFQEFAPEYWAAFEEFFGYLRHKADDDRIVTGWNTVFHSKKGSFRVFDFPSFQLLGARAMHHQIPGFPSIALLHTRTQATSTAPTSTAVVR